MGFDSIIGFFSVYGDNAVVFSFRAIDTVYSINEFLHIEQTLHCDNKFFLVMVYLLMWH
jgi:hypothetical protein